jgi:predicted permease
MQLLDRLRAIPGVDAAADASVLPLSGETLNNRVWTEGDVERRVGSGFSWVSPSYFATLRTSLLAGRDFNANDANNAVKVAIINETFAHDVFKGAHPIGQRFQVEQTPFSPVRTYEVIGVVKNTKYEDLRENFGPIAFMPVAQEPDPDAAGQFLIRSRLPEGQITSAVKSVMTDVNPRMSLSFRNFNTMISELLLRDRLMAILSGFFGLLALILASVGLYGILSYGVASRRNEIGIRMALGAQAGAVLSMIMRESATLAVIGIAVGVPVALGVTRFAQTMLFGLSPTDPLSLSGAALFLFIVAMFAGFIPARRASKVDPLQALRYE